MSEDKLNCSNCSRSCLIKVVEDEGRFYIDGNKCVGGEQYTRENRPHLTDAPLLKLASMKKRGIFANLFARQNK